MLSILSSLCLLAPTLFLAYRQLIDYEQGAFSSVNFGWTSRLAGALFVCNCLLLIIQGVDWFYNLYSFSPDGLNLRRFFIYPGIGFALSIFPRAAADLLFTSGSFATQKIQAQACALIGWLFIFYLGGLLIIPALS